MMSVVKEPATRPATAWSREGPKRVGREVAIARGRDVAFKERRRRKRRRRRREEKGKAEGDGGRGWRERKRGSVRELAQETGVLSPPDPSSFLARSVSPVVP